MPITRSQSCAVTVEQTTIQHTSLQIELNNDTDNLTRHNDEPLETEQNTDQNAPERPQKALSKKGQRRRNNIKIGSLNINGLRTSIENNTEFMKWTEVNATMKREKIAILAVQETHLDEASTTEIHRAFGKRLVIHNSQLENNPRTSAGVAFVLNKELIKTDQVKTFELIKGRAVAIKLTWINNEEATLINVYAPNRRSDHEPFWEETRREWERRNLGKPDLILGDFNITEEPIDRIPAKHDNEAASRAIRGFRLAMGVQDQWRHAHPKAREFTYRAINHGKPIKSRLDRIYISREKAKYAFDWSIAPSTVPTDHWLVSVKYAPKGAPYIGNGRWTWPLRTLKDEKVIKEIVKEGMKLQEHLDRLRQNPGSRDSIANPQSLWVRFKKEITGSVTKNSRTSHYRCLTKIKNLKKDRKETVERQDIEENLETQWHEAILANEIEHLEKLVSYNNREHVKAKISLHGERLGGTWSNMSKSRKPRDVIRQLRIPNMSPPRYEIRSDKMAEMAKNHHETLQQVNVPNLEDPERAQELEDILRIIPDDQKFPDPQSSELNEGITSECVEKALKLAKNGSATGLDGCPYELWKELRKSFELAIKKGKRGFNIVQALTDVFQDIQTHGIEPGTQFADGWMCPLYKKKEPTLIENYRPITLLNTDYKLLTRAISLQLLESIKQLIHRDQAGFIPGRSIFDHIRLSRLMTTFAEVTENNGSIVALDQEKAYDKIDHKYLWKTLEAFELPDLFIQTVKSLYRDAHTMVVINGEFSKPFKVTRGVRQGDPLSCFLFDIGIEPLACLIRNDPNIRGYDIPGLSEKLTVNLFADDTVLYLNAKDSYDDALRSLDRWCRVSGAKFNKEKTEIIPIGTKNHRKRVIQTRKLNPNDQRIPDDVHIAQDGEAIRSLGAWIGNNTWEQRPWEPIIDAVHKDLERWKSVHPTLDGKRLIVQAIVGGRTQFLAKAQGMPKHIREALTKEIRNFIWEDENHAPRLGLNHLENTKEQGGIKLLNL
jgi:exonuclease III